MPPRPVVVGVTGHRILADSARIENGVDEALARIRGAFAGRPIALWSSLAEGADRLVALRALAIADATLVVPLPLEPDDYETDFITPQARREFRELLARAERVIALPVAANRSAAYEAAGLFILSAADALIAVWDGSAAQGRGGTGDIVRAARERRMPLAWVHAGNRSPDTNEPTSLGALQGRTTFENLPQMG